MSTRPHTLCLSYLCEQTKHRKKFQKVAASWQTCVQLARYAVPALMSSPRGQKKKPKQGTSSGKASQQPPTASRTGGSASSLKGAAGAAPGGERASPSRVEQSQKGPGTRKNAAGSGGTSRSTSQENTSSQKSAHDLTGPIKKRTSTSGSKDEGGGGGEGHKDQVSTAKKPTTKAERRALQVWEW